MSIIKKFLQSSLAIPAHITFLNTPKGKFELIIFFTLNVSKPEAVVEEP
jgi:hypothetical protein